MEPLPRGGREFPDGQPFVRGRRRGNGAFAYVMEKANDRKRPSTWTQD